MDKNLDSANDVSVSDPSSASTSSTPTTSAAIDVSARRSCPRCGRRMSSLQFDKHTFCVVCRDIKCSLDTRCKECNAWSKEFMLGYVKHQHTLVSKARKSTSASSPSPPVTAVNTASLVSLPSETFSEDRLRQLVHSMFQDLMSARLGTNQPSTAPPAVPDSATKCTESTGGLRSVTPFEAPSTEFPGVVLPMTQVDLPPPPNTVSVCVLYVARSGVSNFGGSLTTGVGLTISVSRGTDHLRVVNVAPPAVATAASALSPGSLLLPFSDSGFASLSASSSRPLSLPPPPLLSSSVSLASSSSFLASSSFSSLPLLPSPAFPSPAFPSPLAPSAPFSSGSSFSASAAVRPPPGFPPLPPPPPGFAPLAPSVSPLPSSSLLSVSSAPSFSSSLPPVCVSFSAGQAAPVLSSSSSSPLDFTSYQALMLGLSQDYQSLARWYFLSGGSDFRAYLSAFYPHLSSDASRDFSSGSLAFFSALRAVASSVPLPVSSTAPPLPSVAPTVSSSRPPAPLLPAPPFSAPSSVPVPSSLPSRAALQGGGLYELGAASVLAPAPPGFPSLSAPSALLCLLLRYLLLFLLLCLRVSRCSLLLPLLSCLRLLLRCLSCPLLL